MRAITKFIVNRVMRYSEGRFLLMNKVDFIIHTAESMAVVLQKIGEDFGEKYLYDIGYDAGMIAAKEFDANFGWVKMPLSAKMRVIYSMFEVMGYGKLDIKTWDSKKNRLMYHVVNHPVLNSAKKLYGKKMMVCAHYMGMESAHYHNEMGIDNCKVFETLCVGHNHPYCEWSYNYFDDKKIKKIRGP